MLFRSRKKLDVGIHGRTLTAQVDNELSGYGQVGIGSTQPEQKFDVIGNVKFSAQMYDSLNSPGALGAFLTKDRQGIKWTIFEPSFTEGIFVYNDGILVGVNSFRGLNLITGNGGGITTDNVEGYVNASNPFIADIYVTDNWSANEFNTSCKRIYVNKQNQ